MPVQESKGESQRLCPRRDLQIMIQASSGEARRQSFLTLRSSRKAMPCLQEDAEIRSSSRGPPATSVDEIIYRQKLTQARYNCILWRESIRTILRICKVFTNGNAAFYAQQKVSDTRTAKKSGSVSVSRAFREAFPQQPELSRDCLAADIELFQCDHRQRWDHDLVSLISRTRY